MVGVVWQCTQTSALEAGGEEGGAVGLEYLRSPPPRHSAIPLPHTPSSLLPLPSLPPSSPWAARAAPHRTAHTPHTPLLRAPLGHITSSLSEGASVPDTGRVLHIRVHPSLSCPPAPPAHPCRTHTRAHFTVCRCLNRHGYGYSLHLLICPTAPPADRAIRYPLSR